MTSRAVGLDFLCRPKVGGKFEVRPATQRAGHRLKVTTQMIKNIIANFISDERGVESMEFGVGGIIVAGGAVKGLTDTKEIIQDKNQAMLDKLGESSID